MNDVQLHHVTQTKLENRQTIETKDTCLGEESFMDRSFLVLEILREGHGYTSQKSPW